MGRTKILFLLANPVGTEQISINDEIQRVQEIHRKSTTRDKFELKICTSVRIDNIQQELLDFKPNIIHFSGHSSKSDITITNQTSDQSYKLTKDVLSNLLNLCSPHLKAVILNSCSSIEEIESYGHEFDFIGMTELIEDQAAISFSSGFYTAFFSELNIEKSFEAGISQMKIDDISEDQVRIPNIKQRIQTYVPQKKTDIIVSVSTDENEWGKVLIEYIKKKLQQNLGVANGFNIDVCNELINLDETATLLIILSNKYLMEYKDKLSAIRELLQNDNVFLIEHGPCKRPDELKGIFPYKFWSNSDENGLTNISGSEFFSKADEVTLNIANRLKSLKSDYLLSNNIVGYMNNNKGGENSESYVFINSAPEDIGLANVIAPILKSKGIEYVLPIERNSQDISPDDIDRDIETNITYCGAILILYERSSLSWARQQVIICNSLKRKRKSPLKIVAIHKSKDRPELNIQFNNVSIYDCPPENVNSYLRKFIEAL